MTLREGDLILNGKYQILKLIGEGGMARVWLAEEPEFGGRRVAIKEPSLGLLDPAERQVLERRFQQETKLAPQLEQAGVPNVVRAYTLERLPDGTQLLVMEYMAGGSLADLIAAHPDGMPVERAISITLDILQALAGFHRLPIAPVHRDVKPENILLDSQGRARLSDLGLAQLPGVSGRSQLGAGPHSGTPLYMAPEQAASPQPLTPAADLYALGCVLFEMLTGQRHKRVRPGTTASNLRLGVPGWLDGVLAKALAEDPWNRYQNAEEMATALRAAPAGAASHGPRPAATAPSEIESARQPATPASSGSQARSQLPTTSQPGPGKGRRLNWWAGVAGLLLVALVVAIAVLLGGGGSGGPGTSPATVVAFTQDAPSPTPTALAPTLPTAIPSRGEPTQTSMPPTNTPRPPTAAPVRATATRIPPTATHVPPTATRIVPSVTPKPLQEGSTQTRSKDGMVILYVPAGPFLMGSTNDDGQATDDEKPQHSVILDAFWIDKTEVTNAQYQKCVTAGACRVADMASYDPQGKPNHPVVEVTWNDAQAYCKWAGAGLPTEAQWEKAARGTDGRLYPWGNESPDCNRANFWDHEGGCVGHTAAVGSYPAGASPYGALDMTGNAWEWVADWYGGTYYWGSPERNPTGPESGQHRGLRGGSWTNSSPWWYVRAANRNTDAPTLRGQGVGFRCATADPGR